MRREKYERLDDREVAIRNIKEKLEFLYVFLGIKKEKAAQTSWDNLIKTAKSIDSITHRIEKQEIAKNSLLITFDKEGNLLVPTAHFVFPKKDFNNLVEHFQAKIEQLALSIIPEQNKQEDDRRIREVYEENFGRNQQENNEIKKVFMKGINDYIKSAPKEKQSNLQEAVPILNAYIETNGSIPTTRDTLKAFINARTYQHDSLTSARVQREIEKENSEQFQFSHLPDKVINKAYKLYAKGHDAVSKLAASKNSAQNDKLRKDSLKDNLSATKYGRTSMSKKHSSQQENTQSHEQSNVSSPTPTQNGAKQ